MLKFICAMKGHAVSPFGGKWVGSFMRPCKRCGEVVRIGDGYEDSTAALDREIDDLIDRLNRCH